MHPTEQLRSLSEDAGCFSWSSSLEGQLSPTQQADIEGSLPISPQSGGVPKATRQSSGWGGSSQFSPEAISQEQYSSRLCLQCWLSGSDSHPFHCLEAPALGLSWPMPKLCPLCLVSLLGAMSNYHLATIEAIEVEYQCSGSHSSSWHHEFSVSPSVKWV